MKIAKIDTQSISCIKLDKKKNKKFSDQQLGSGLDLFYGI